MNVVDTLIDLIESMQAGLGLVDGATPSHADKIFIHSLWSLLNSIHNVSGSGRMGAGGMSDRLCTSESKLRKCTEFMLKYHTSFAAGTISRICLFLSDIVNGDPRSARTVYESGFSMVAVNSMIQTRKPYYSEFVYVAPLLISCLCLHNEAHAAIMKLATNPIKLVIDYFGDPLCVLSASSRSANRTGKYIMSLVQGHSDFLEVVMDALMEVTRGLGGHRSYESLEAFAPYCFQDFPAIGSRSIKLFLLVLHSVVELESVANAFVTRGGLRLLLQLHQQILDPKGSFILSAGNKSTETSKVISVLSLVVHSLISNMKEGVLAIKDLISFIPGRTELIDVSASFLDGVPQDTLLSTSDPVVLNGVCDKIRHLATVEWLCSLLSKCIQGRGAVHSMDQHRLLRHLASQLMSDENMQVLGLLASLDRNIRWQLVSFNEFPADTVAHVVMKQLMAFTKSFQKLFKSLAKMSYSNSRGNRHPFVMLDNTEKVAAEISDTVVKHFSFHSKELPDTNYAKYISGILALVPIVDDSSKGMTRLNISLAKSLFDNQVESSVIFDSIFHALGKCIQQDDTDAEIILGFLSRLLSVDPDKSLPSHASAERQLEIRQVMLKIRLDIVGRLEPLITDDHILMEAKFAGSLLQLCTLLCKGPLDDLFPELGSNDASSISSQRQEFQAHEVIVTQLTACGFSSAHVRQAQATLRSNNVHMVTDWLILNPTEGDEDEDEEDELQMALRMSMGENHSEGESSNKDDEDHVVEESTEDKERAMKIHERRATLLQFRTKSFAMCMKLIRSFTDTENSLIFVERAVQLFECSEESISEALINLTQSVKAEISSFPTATVQVLSSMLSKFKKPIEGSLEEELIECSHQVLEILLNIESEVQDMNWCIASVVFIEILSHKPSLFQGPVVEKCTKVCDTFLGTQSNASLMHATFLLLVRVIRYSGYSCRLLETLCSNVVMRLPTESRFPGYLTLVSLLLSRSMEFRDSLRLTMAGMVYTLLEQHRSANTLVKQLEPLWLRDSKTLEEALEACVAVKTVGGDVAVSFRQDARVRLVKANSRYVGRSIKEIQQNFIVPICDAVFARFMETIPDAPAASETFLNLSDLLHLLTKVIRLHPWTIRCIQGTKVPVHVQSAINKFWSDSLGVPSVKQAGCIVDFLVNGVLGCENESESRKDILKAALSLLQQLEHANIDNGSDIVCQSLLRSLSFISTRENNGDNACRIFAVQNWVVAIRLVLHGITPSMKNVGFRKEGSLSTMIKTLKGIDMNNALASAVVKNLLHVASYLSKRSLITDKKTGLSKRTLSGPSPEIDMVEDSFASWSTKSDQVVQNYDSEDPEQVNSINELGEALDEDNAAEEEEMFSESENGEQEEVIDEVDEEVSSDSEEEGDDEEEEEDDDDDDEEMDDDEDEVEDMMESDLDHEAYFAHERRHDGMSDSSEDSAVPMFQIREMPGRGAGDEFDEEEDEATTIAARLHRAIQTMENHDRRHVTRIHIEAALSLGDRATAADSAFGEIVSNTEAENSRLIFAPAQRLTREFVTPYGIFRHRRPAAVNESGDMPSITAITRAMLHPTVPSNAPNEPVDALRVRSNGLFGAFMNNSVRNSNEAPTPYSEFSNNQRDLIKLWDCVDSVPDDNQPSILDMIQGLTQDEPPVVETVGPIELGGEPSIPNIDTVVDDALSAPDEQPIAVDENVGMVVEDSLPVADEQSTDVEEIVGIVDDALSAPDEQPIAVDENVGMVVDDAFPVSDEQSTAVDENVDRIVEGSLPVADEQSTAVEGNVPMIVEDSLPVPDEQSTDAGENVVPFIEGETLGSQEGLPRPDDVDAGVWDNLPDEIKYEILQQRGIHVTSTDDAFLAAMPEEIRAEILREQESNRAEEAPANIANAEDMDNASFIASLEPELRQQIFLDLINQGSNNTVIASLPPHLRTEAELLRFRQGTAAHRMQQQESDEKEEPKEAIINLGMEMGGKAMLLKSDIQELLRLVFLPRLPSMLKDVLKNLCAHPKTRTWIIECLIAAMQSHPEPHAWLPVAMLGLQENGTGANCVKCDDDSVVVPPIVSARVLELLKHIGGRNPRVCLHILVSGSAAAKEAFGASSKYAKLESSAPCLENLMELVSLSAYRSSSTHLLAIVDVLVMIASPLAQLSVAIESDQVSGAGTESKEALEDEDDEKEDAKTPTKMVAKVPHRELGSKYLRVLAEVLTADSCTDSVFNKATALVQLLSKVSTNRKFLRGELCRVAEKLGSRVLRDLGVLDGLLCNNIKELHGNSLAFSSSSNEIKLLRILRTVHRLAGNESETLFDELHLTELWKLLSKCLEAAAIDMANIIDPSVKVETETVDSPDSLHLKNSSKSVAMAFAHARLPMIKAFFLVNGAVEDTTRENELVEFVQKNAGVLNALVSQSPGLLEEAFVSLVKIARCRFVIDFANKRQYFNNSMKKHRRNITTSIKLRVRRSHVFQDSFLILRQYTKQELLKGKLSVDFEGEEGIDAGGVTREWYEILAREIFKPDYALFKPSADSSAFQPDARSHIVGDHFAYFKFVGRVVGKALADGQLMDAHFTRSFYKHMLGLKVTAQDMQSLDPVYYNSLMELMKMNIDEVGLEFTFIVDTEEFGKMTTHELKPDGNNILVTEENKKEYLRLVTQFRMTSGIRLQIDSFLEGFHELIPRVLIQIFDENELELVISGIPAIEISDLKDNTEYVSYNLTSPQIRWFWEILEAWPQEHLAKLLMFVTGTSKVPLEGFKALVGMRGSQKFSIHKAYGGDSSLPTAHTCFNQLDLPEYSTKEILKEKLSYAVLEGGEGFGFA